MEFVDGLTQEFLLEQIQLLEREISDLNNGNIQIYTLEDFQNFSLSSLIELFLECGIEQTDAIRLNHYLENKSHIDTFATLFSSNAEREKEYIQQIINRFNVINQENRIMEQEEKLEYYSFILSNYKKLLDCLYGYVELNEEKMVELQAFIFNINQNCNLNLNDSEICKLSETIAINQINKKLELLRDGVILEQDSEQHNDDLIEIFNEQLETINNRYINETAEIQQYSIEDMIENMQQLNEGETVLEEPQELSLEEQKYLELKKYAMVKFLEFTNQNNNLFGKSSYSFTTIEELENISIVELEELINLEGLTIDNFVLYVSSMIKNIIDKLDYENCFSNLKKLDSIYQEYLVNKEQLINKLKNISTSLNVLINNNGCNANNTEVINIFEQVSKLIDEIEKNVLSKERVEEIEKEIIILFEKYEQIQTIGRDVNVEQIPIRAFTLFERDNSNQVPYIITDMDYKGKKALIDEMVFNGNKGKNYPVLLSNLMTDLLLYGDSERNTVGLGEIRIGVEDVFYTKGKKEKTGMHRIRPTKTSLIRFGEQKITLQAGTEIYKQVTTLLKEYLPNAIIDQNNDFEIIVNLATGIKIADEGMYDEMVKRRDSEGSQILELFDERGRNIRKYHMAKNLKIKQSLNQEEIAMLRSIIESSLKVYDDMRTINVKNKEYSYNFDTVDRLRGMGVPSYELQ